MGRDNKLRMDIMELLSEGIQSTPTIHEGFKKNSSRFPSREKQVIRDAFATLSDQKLVELVWEKNNRGKSEKYYALTTLGAKWYFQHKKQDHKKLWETLFTCSDTKYANYYVTKTKLRNKNRITINGQYLANEPKRRTIGFNAREVLEFYETQLNLEPKLFFGENVKKILNDLETSNFTDRFVSEINGEDHKTFSKILGVKNYFEESNIEVLPREIIISTVITILGTLSENNKLDIKKIHNNLEIDISKENIERIIHFCYFTGLLIHHFEKNGLKSKLSIFGILLIFAYIMNKAAEQFYGEYRDNRKMFDDTIFQIIQKNQDSLPRVFNKWGILRRKFSDLGLLDIIVSQFFTTDRHFRFQDKKTSELDLIQTIKTLEVDYKEKFEEIFYSGIQWSRKWSEKNLKYLSITEKRFGDQDDFSMYLRGLFRRLSTIESKILKKKMHLLTNLNVAIIRTIKENSFGDKKLELLLIHLVREFCEDYFWNQEIKKDPNRIIPDFRTIIEYTNDIANIIRHRSVFEEIIHLREILFSTDTFFGQMDTMFDSDYERLLRRLLPVQNLISFQFYSGLYALNPALWEEIMKLDSELLSWYQNMVSSIIQTEKIIYNKKIEHQTQIQKLIVRSNSNGDRNTT